MVGTNIPKSPDLDDSHFAKEEDPAAPGGLKHPRDADYMQ